MAIKNLRKSLVEVGKIKIGGKNPNKTYKGKDGKQHRAPVKFDYFMITTLDKDMKDNFVPDQKVMAKLGEKPKRLKIFLLSDDVDNNFMTEYSCYAGARRACHGDGETAERYFKEGGKKTIPTDQGNVEIQVQAGQKVPVKCDPETCPIFLEGKCKPHGILSVMLAESEVIGGVHKFRTTSWNTIANINSSLESIKILTGGVLFGIPLTMELIEKQTEEHGKIKVVNIIYEGGIEKLQLEASRQKQLRIDGSVSMASQNALIKSSCITEDHDSAHDVQEEYYSIEESEEPGTDGEGLAEDLKSQESENVQPAEEAAGDDSELPFF